MKGERIDHDEALGAIERSITACFNAIAKATSAIVAAETSEGKKRERAWESVFYHQDEAELYYSQAVAGLKALVAAAGHTLPTARGTFLHELLTSCRDILGSLKTKAELG